MVTFPTDIFIYDAEQKTYKQTVSGLCLFGVPAIQPGIKLYNPETGNTDIYNFIQVSSLGNNSVWEYMSMDEIKLKIMEV